LEYKFEYKKAREEESKAVVNVVHGEEQILCKHGGLLWVENKV
jgi:hypothetical protein